MMLGRLRRARHFLFWFPLLAAGGCLGEKVKKDPYEARVVAEFDPGAAKPVLPAPTDMAFDAVAGHVAIPDAVAETEAEKQLFAYLTQLDGYPASSIPWMTFSGDIDEATLLNAVMLFDMNGTDSPPDFSATYDAAAHRLLLAPRAPFTAGHSYGIVVRSGSGTGVRDVAGKPVLASPAFYLVRGDKSLVTCKDLASPNCQAVSDVIPAQSKDPTKARAERRDAAIALEKVRLGLLPLYDKAKDKGVARAEIVLAWTFHISTTPTARFDPDPASKSETPIPFPNDILKNQTTGKLDIPIAASDPDQIKKLKMKLATLDGFSTTAPIRAGVDLPVLPPVGGGSPTPQKLAPESLKEGVLIAPALMPADKADFLPAWEEESQSVIALLRRALRSRTLYFGALTSKITTTDGRPLRAPLSIALLRMTTEVWKDGKSQIRGIPDDLAMQAEIGRKALFPAFALAEAMLKTPREEMAVLFPFTTQTVSEVLPDLRALPTTAGYPTKATASAITPDPANPRLADPYDWGYDFTDVASIVEGDFDTPLLLDGITGFKADWTQHKPEKVHYILTVPKCTPPGAAKPPVAISLHALTGFYREGLGIAGPFAKACWATAHFDLPLHGDRAICFSDGDCVSNSCNPATAKCNGAGGFVKWDNGNPKVSGLVFVNPNDLFATRDNMRQAIIDLAQFIRVLRAADGPAGPGGANIDASRLSLVGVSMGGMIATMAGASMPELESVVFSTTAADLIDVLGKSPTYGPMITAQLAMYGLAPGTRGYRDFDVVARWVMDVAEPWNYAELVVGKPLKDTLTGMPIAPKKVMVQMAGADMVMPNVYTKLLADLLGTSLGKTTFDLAEHQVLTNIFDPQWLPAATQAAGFVASGGTMIP